MQLLYETLHPGTPLGTGDRAHIAAAFQPLQLHPGDHFVRFGQHRLRLGFIAVGSVADVELDDGVETVRWIYSEGAFVGDLPNFLARQPASLALRATEATTLYTLTYDGLLELRRSVRGWPQIEQRLLGSCILNLREQLATNQQLTAPERYHRFFEQRGELFNRIPHKTIASFLNMSPETLSRIRRKQVSVS